MQMLKCTQCGAGIPLGTSKREVQCNFCNSVFQVVRKRSNGKPSPGQLGLFLSGVLIGGIGGFLIGWPASRAVAAATAKVSMAELERRIQQWGKERG